MGKRTHKSLPSGCCTTRPKGPKPAQNQPVDGKDTFRLDARSDFWEARSCQTSSFPQASPQRLACVVSGVWFPSRTVDERRDRISRAAQSVRQNFVVFKRSRATACGVVREVVRRRGSFCSRKFSIEGFAMTGIFVAGFRAGVAVILEYGNPHGTHERHSARPL